jgi:hypothetical protein
MKTLILLLFLTIAQAQNTTIHFFYGGSENLGSEILFKIKGTENTYIGGGFSGALNQRKALGTFLVGNISSYDLKQKSLGHLNEQWCSIYATSSFGFLNTVQVKYRLGLAVSNKKAIFESSNGKYNKIDREIYEPLIGISFMKEITKDYAIEAGIDNFNKITVGFTVLF